LQTNYQVATSLYETAAALVQESRTENVLDLYCGAGAFSLMASSTAMKVLGIDVSANAIECAEEASRRNGLLNAEYQCRSLECTTADQLSGCEFDTIICNPPRRGLDAATVSLIRTIRPERVLYSSCNAKTLQRDVLALAGEYRVESLRPFDMFPFTTHFEVLALLVRK
jgi:23S rRNA (uracil747-C5)-methyltransferase